MKRILESCFVLFLFLNLSFAADVEVKLTTNDGTTKFAVQDSGAIDVAGIDSDGNMILEGSATIKGVNGLRATYGITACTITLNSGAANVATIDSDGNMILEGSSTVKGAKGLKTTYGITASTITLTASDGGDAVILRSGGDLRIYNANNSGSALLWCDDDSVLDTNSTIVSPSYALAITPPTCYPMRINDAPSWKSNTAAEDWDWAFHRVYVSPLDFHPNGKIQLKVVVFLDNDTGASYFTWRDANNNYFGAYTTVNGSSPGEWKESSWQDYQPSGYTSPIDFRISAYSASGYYGIYYAYLLVRPQRVYP